MTTTTCLKMLTVGCLAAFYVGCDFYYFAPNDGVECSDTVTEDMCVHLEVQEDAAVKGTYLSLSAAFTDQDGNQIGEPFTLQTGKNILGRPAQNPSITAIQVRALSATGTVAKASSGLRNLRSGKLIYNIMLLLKPGM